jgi:hypothetical protein
MEQNTETFFLGDLASCFYTFTKLPTQIEVCVCLLLKVLTYEKKGGLKVVAFDRSPFKGAQA